MKRVTYTEVERVVRTAGVSIALTRDEAVKLLALIGQFGHEYSSGNLFSDLLDALKTTPELVFGGIRDWDYTKLARQAQDAIKVRAAILENGPSLTDPYPEG